MTKENWDKKCDVLVVGSGAGALTSAITAHDQGLDVYIIEKSDHYGGTSASSGGGVWVPAGDRVLDVSAWRYCRGIGRRAGLAGAAPLVVRKEQEMIRALPDPK